VEVPPTLDPVAFLRKHLEEGADADQLREMLRVFIERLMGAEVDAICNLGYGEVILERLNSWNGLRHRDFDTRAGTIDLAIPKLRGPRRVE
jgi:putative transposase